MKHASSIFNGIVLVTGWAASIGCIGAGGPGLPLRAAAAETEAATKPPVAASNGAGAGARAAALAADSAAGRFELSSKVVPIAEVGDTTNLVLRTAAAEISFLPPAGWRMLVEPAESRMTWTSPDFTSVLILRVVADDDGALRASPRSAGQALIVRELPEVEVTGDFPCYTAGSSGWAFAVRRATVGREVATGRVAMLPISGAGAGVTLRLMSPASQEVRRQNELGMFLNSLRSAALERPRVASRR